MTNLDKFCEYLKSLPTPKHFVAWNYYFAVSSCLGRRVWEGPLDYAPTFANQYLIFVGDPGSGKSLPANNTRKLLESLVIPPEKANEHKTVEQMEQDKLLGLSTPLSALNMAPDDCSVERLIDLMTHGTRSFRYYDNDAGKEKSIAHTSFCACLSEELATLFREKQTVLVQFLNAMWNGGDHRRETHKHKKQVIKNCCMNLLGCAVPDWIARNIHSDLLDTGFAARTLFLYGEYKERRKGIIQKPPPLNIQYYEDLREHLQTICTISGEVSFTDEAAQFIDDKTALFLEERVNPDKRLNSYYVRKHVHWKKLAMNMHFGESTTMTIPLETVEKALVFLEATELNMHLALASMEKHPVHVVAETILDRLRKTETQTPAQLKLLTWDDGGARPQETFDMALGHLIDTKQIETTTVDNVNIKYRLIR